MVGHVCMHAQETVVLAQGTLQARLQYGNRGDFSRTYVYIAKHVYREQWVRITSVYLPIFATALHAFVKYNVYVNTH